MFATSLAAYPLTFTYAGEAESADGKADVIDVKGEGDFAVRLFIDQTDAPAADAELDGQGTAGDDDDQRTGRARCRSAAAAARRSRPTMGGGAAWRSACSRPAAQAPSREEMEKRMKEMEERRKEAEAKRRTVEYRVYYADYQAVNGVMLPHRSSGPIDGKPTEEMVFDTAQGEPEDRRQEVPGLEVGSRG